MNEENIYFANKKPEDTARILIDKSQTFYHQLSTNAYIDTMYKMWQAYYGLYSRSGGNTHEIKFGGEQGELVYLNVNHFRNLAQHMLVMITANRPIMEARAINTDYKSLAQTYLANSILEYYMREKRLEDVLKKAVEMAIVMGSGFVKMEWNATAGELYDADPETGEMNYEGEIEFSNLSPFDVVFDGTKEGWDQDWVLCRSSQNRHDLVAKYPEYADKILAIPKKHEVLKFNKSLFSNDDTDDIFIYEFFHKRTEATPEGRYMLFVDTDVVLLDTKMPYRQLPIFRISPSDIMGTPYGYSPMFDIFPIQEGINSLYSTIMTNQNANGVQNIWIKPGADINVDLLGGALNVIESEEKPEALQLTSTPKEIFDFLNMLIQSAETISGVNSVSRGNPEASLKSGTALALVQSMSLQFISGLQQSYVKLIEDTGTALVSILKDFATTPKVVAVVGKNNRPYLKEFTGESISAVNRVIVDVGNPLSKCFAKGTQILMFDGSKKNVEDVKIGDWVMGPDSNPRTVCNTANGKEEMFEIKSKDKHRRVNYVCNRSHILTLKYCSDDYRYNVKKGDVIDISIDEYLKKTNREKRLLQGFKTGVEFSKKDLKIPPYILGTWIGDGSKYETTITSMDEEIVAEWQNYADSLGLHMYVRCDNSGGRAKTYTISSKKQNGSNNRNPFKTLLRSYNLIENKHIPEDYLYSSREDRLELLAGLIDTDGHLVKNSGTYIFTQKTSSLTEKIVFLAESLGFRVTYRTRKKSKSKLCPNASGTMDSITIGGNTWEIPVRLPRKKTKEAKRARDWNNYGIEVTSLGEGEYYGFTLKEEPHFLLGDFTVTHNTTAGKVQMAEQLLQMGLLKTPQQYFQVMNTGRLDSAYEEEMDELLLIKRENELLMEGQPALVSPLDQHQQHILEHRAVLADPDLRTDPDLVRNVMDHIQSHMDALRNTDPALLQMTGQQPLPPPGMAPPPPGGPQGEAGPPDEAGAGMAPPPNGYPQSGDQVGGPNMEGAVLPSVPSPPAPFENEPVLAQDMLPQG